MACITYDDKADVLYVTYKEGPADRGREFKPGIVRRYIGNEVGGITIINFAERLRAGEFDVSAVDGQLTGETK